MGLDVKTILNMCSTKFVLIKREQDDYSWTKGSDIDIFAESALQLSAEILHLSRSVIESGMPIHITRHEEHYHIDYMDKDDILVRLDIIDTLEGFKELLFDHNKYAHLAFRLLEYAKYPQKKNHLKYIKDVLLKG